MAIKKLTPSVLKRIILEEKQKIIKEDQRKDIEKQYRLLMLLERLDMKNTRRTVKLRKVKRILKKRILKRR